MSSFSNSVSRNKGEDNEAKDGEVVPEDIGNFYEQLDKDLDEKEDRKKNTNVWQFEIEQDKVGWTSSVTTQLIIELIAVFRLRMFKKDVSHWNIHF